MAISPPSDIVLDVARAIEPNALEAARTKLMSIAGNRNAEAGEFSSAVSAAGMRGEPAGRVEPKGAASGAFVQFEAMVLQNFVEKMLPSDAENVYGTGVAGEMWKSFLAQELGTEMAKAGGIGISDRVLGDYYVEGDKNVPLVGVQAESAEKQADETKSLLSTALIQEIQRTIVGSVTETAVSATGVTSGE